MAYDIWTKTETGRDWGIALPPSSAGSWLSDKILSLTTWQKLVLAGGAAVGVSLLVHWLVKPEKQSYVRQPRKTGGFLEETQRLPMPHETMRKIVHQRLR